MVDVNDENIKADVEPHLYNGKLYSIGIHFTPISRSPVISSNGFWLDGSATFSYFNSVVDVIEQLEYSNIKLSYNRNDITISTGSEKRNRVFNVINYFLVYRSI